MYLGIVSYMAVLHMICMSSICLMFCSTVCHATPFLQSNTPPASHSKLICIVSVGSIVTFGTQVLLTGT